MWLVIAIAIALTLLSGAYAAKNFAINADVTTLISQDLPWRQRELAYEKVFPHGLELIVAVVDAPTPEQASAASKLLRARLTAQPDLFRAVQAAGSGEFFDRNKLLFLPTDQLNETLGKLQPAAPIVTPLAADPSLRGLVQALSLPLSGVQGGQFPLDGMARILTMAADVVDDVLAGRPARFSWYELVNGRPSQAHELRRVLTIRPVLDFNALEPGGLATAAIRQAAKELNLARDYEARVRLTGPVAIADDEFGTLKEGIELNSAVTIAVVLLILWLALKSGRIILAVFLNLVVGLAITAAVGLMMVGALNLISVAFAVLFIGLGVDFGIQYSVRYRNERHECQDLRQALILAGDRAGAPLTLAAAAVAAGFLSFLPTDYKGVSELGQIAGVGMVIAFITSITLLPALLYLFNPGGEKEPLGYAALAPVDEFLERNRVPVIVGTLLVAIGGLPLLWDLRFDFNPMNLRSTGVESIATYRELQSGPGGSSHTAEVLAPTLAEAGALAQKLAALPEVGRVMLLDAFIPRDQDKKLPMIAAAAARLQNALNPRAPKPPPTDAETIAALRGGAEALIKTAGDASGSGAVAAKRLAAGMTKLADGSPAQRDAVAAAIVNPLVADLSDLRNALKAGPVTRESLPPDLARDWVAPDGRARVEASLKGDPNDNEAIRSFARAVLKVAPDATGESIGILESGETIVSAFIHAGAWALISITILLILVLRRISDVLLTLVPLILAGVVTLEICVIIDFPMNFANIIALPLLLGVGVAFKIYYVMAWRGGTTRLLQSSLTRAVIFSALTTATAFGSLWFSSHPGTSSMGKLLALSLVCTLAAAVLFQPALMGRPRDVKPEGSQAS